ncbi:thioredoxin family protein [Fibrella arboris]|uniref:thioredoxin family protein n=1 Tax=Fibrella arboris TaxID=3242486 RepID=UPI003522DBE1
MRLSALFFTLLFVGLFFSFRPAVDRPAVPAPAAEGKTINWLSFKEAFDLNQKAPRKIIIDVYTGWCGWCKVMDQKTFSQPAIIDYVNEHYYAVKLDAEQAADITVGGQTFRKQGNAHELAVNLLQGKMSYPSTVFLDEKMAMIQPIAGYLEPRMFHQVITYFGGNYQAKEPFDTFKAGTYVKEFQPAMPAPAPGK